MKKRYSDDVNSYLNMTFMTNSSYFLLTILLKKLKLVDRQQYYFSTSSIYNNNSLMLPKLRQKSCVDFNWMPFP